MAEDLHELPVISLDGVHSDPAALSEALLSACRAAGFFFVVDHGLPQTTVDEAFAISNEYFNLTQEAEKLKYNFSPKTGLGYSGIGRETLDVSLGLTQGDLKESFYLARFADNPEQEPLPPFLASKKAQLTALQTGLEGISLRLLTGLARALDLEDDAFTRSHGGKENRLRLIHYPFSQAKNHVSAASAHSDYGSITLLLTDGVPGLQVKRKDGTWFDVPHKPGAIIVNIADALEFWSGGILNSTLHQVVMPQNDKEGSETATKERFSIAYFVQPDFDTTLHVMTKSENFSDADFDKRVASKGIQPGTRRLTSGEFLKARLAASYS